MDRGSKTARKEPGKWNSHGATWVWHWVKFRVLCQTTFAAGLHWWLTLLDPYLPYPRQSTFESKAGFDVPLVFFPKLWTLKEARLQLKMQWRAVLGRQRVQAENCWVSYFLSCFSAICTTWRVVFKLKLSLSARIYVHQGYPPTACR